MGGHGIDISEGVGEEGGVEIAQGLKLATGGRRDVHGGRGDVGYWIKSCTSGSCTGAAGA